MAKTILVMGLPGSGKTTFANKLRQKLGDADHFNADEVRKRFDDWDFSEEGRLRQAERMRVLGAESEKQWAILDFVCPKVEYRHIVTADVIVWMDTIGDSRYEDTNAMFEEPINESGIISVDYHFTEFDSDAQSDEVVKDLQPFDWRKETVQMLGRWQPWHPGHFELFKRCYEKTGQVCIQVRDVQGWDDSNPFDFEQVRRNIIKGLSEEGFTHGKEYVIMLVPNITNITYGRKVGYKIEQEHFDEKVESISATAIRKEMGLK